MKTLLGVLGAAMTLALLAVPTAWAGEGEGLWPETFQPAPYDCGAFTRDANNFCHLDDNGSVELGVKFTSSRTLDLVGVRAYRTDIAPTSYFSGSLWTEGGTRVASGTEFGGAAANGWQDVLFDDPVRIGSGQTYVASYFAPNANYAFNWFFFTASAYTPPGSPVTALQSVAGNRNGVYCYVGESCAGFPANAFQDTNYWVTPLWDDQAPALPALSDLTEEATSASGALVTYATPTSTDVAGVDPDPSESCTPGSGTTFPLGDTTVTCTATDASGNESTGTFSVTVEDSTAPTLAAHADVTAEATSPSGATVNYTNPAATDAVDPDPNVACEPASGETFTLGDTAVACTATDDAGNDSTSQFTVTVQDTTGPTVSHDDVEATAKSASGTRVYYGSPTVTDAVDPDPAVTCAPAGAVFAPGDTTVTCTATDAAGNSGTGTFTVKVRFAAWDFLPPIGKSKVMKGMKAGSTLPIKWRVSDGRGRYIDDVSIVDSVTITCTTTTTEREHGGRDDDDRGRDDRGRSAGKRSARKRSRTKRRVRSLAGTVVRYDDDDDQFIYNWKSPKQPGTCQIVVTLIDTSYREVQVTLR